MSKALHKQFRQSPVFDKYFMGFSLYDPGSGTVIHEINSDKYFTPASNTKLFTFYASVKYLGDSIQALKYVNKGDSLIFWGTGDPSFLHPDLHQNEKVFNFLKNQSGVLVFSGQNYFNQRFGPGWAWDDYPYYYSVETASFPVYGNTVRFSAAPFNTLRVSPEVFTDSVQHKSANHSPRPRIIRAEHSNRFYFHPHQLPRDTTVIPLKYSMPTLIHLLQDTLGRHVSHQSLPIDPASKTLYSIPADSVYKIMLQESDNFLAEQLLLLVGAAINDSLHTSKTITYLQDSLLSNLPDKPIWVDGSGLSRYNLFTPRTMVKLLENIYQSVPEDRLFQLMPAGGVNGTIASWYEGEKPYIFAKTGTLSNNHCLSGYLITASGKRLIFSFMHNNYPFGSSVTKKAMAPILAFIRANY
ncbi:D-alanyl-D-alanine carboxypeptidase [Fulvivirgaceae bacterium BMA12]|uniref:D-alanyl-D-alanine carboxypeptidase n=1 Tax=Agaribacillus aureus TaxID=3051825 RepID=A0ABT8LEY8_9BACT|nr:D-alanyl-D-alanine carboxypeptidase [Fulvivirgaceae bacterium BMA12]